MIVLCDLRSNNNDSKHAFSAIFISVFSWDINFRWVVCLNMCSYAVCTQCMIKNDTVCLGCQYTDLYSHIICYMFVQIIFEFQNIFFFQKNIYFHKTNLQKKSYTQYQTHYIQKARNEG